jgi:AGCS family alanine or glycine:cation symporter
MGASLLFGLSTLISWAFYGEQAAAYLFGARARAPYRALYCVAIMGGSLATVRTIWAWADLLNGLMAIPNLLAVLFLAGELARGRGARSGATS